MANSHIPMDISIRIGEILNRKSKRKKDTPWREIIWKLWSK